MRALAISSSILLGLCTLMGCAPLGNFRPADGLMPGKTGEMGGGTVVVGPRPYVDERAHATGQLWISGRPAKRITLTGVGAFDTAALALGSGVRVDVVQSSRVAAGVEAELGFLYGAASIPVSLRVLGQSRLYTSPRFGTRGLTWSIDLPVGVSIPIHGGWMVRAEYTSSWAELLWYQHRHQAGMAVAYQF